MSDDENSMSTNGSESMSAIRQVEDSASDDDDAPNQSINVPGKSNEHNHQQNTDIWYFFTNSLDAHLETSAECKHCGESVDFAGNPELVKQHLLSCAEFSLASEKFSPEQSDLWSTVLNRKPLIRSRGNFMLFVE